MNVIFLYADNQSEWNCSHWRCHLLSNGINKRHEENPQGFPHQAKMFYLMTALDIHHPTVQTKLGWADVILFQRTVIHDAMWSAMDYWRMLGKIVVIDLDDGYSCIPASNPAFASWILNSLGMEPAPVPALEEGLRHAHALIAPNRVLLKDWAHVAQGYFWPNYPSAADFTAISQKPIGAADVEYFYPPEAEVIKMRDASESPDSFKPPLLSREKPAKTIIGWGGSLSHIDSFVYSGVVEALQRILAEFPHVAFKFCGNDSRLDPIWAKFPKDQFIRQQGVLPGPHWPQVLSSFDIGIAPMDMRPIEGATAGNVNDYSYDERRSSLKLVEYLCAGVPFVATRCEPYMDLGHMGKLVENTGQAWYEALRERIIGLPTFKALAATARDYALKKLTIEANAERLIALYARIGEEAQAKAGMRAPGIEIVEPSDPKDAELGPIYAGDPLLVGRAEHGAAVAVAARELALEPWLTVDDTNIGRAIEYPILEQLNRLHG